MNTIVGWVLVAWALLLGIVVAMIFTANPDPLANYQDLLEKQLPVSSDIEPYGGCDEAWQAPNSPGAAWCAKRTGK